MAYNTSTSATDINRCESYAQHVRVEQTFTTKKESIVLLNWYSAYL